MEKKGHVENNRDGYFVQEKEWTDDGKRPEEDEPCGEVDKMGIMSDWV